MDDLKGKPGGSGAVGLFCVDKKTIFVLILGTVLAHVGHGAYPGWATCLPRLGMVAVQNVPKM